MKKILFIFTMALCFIMFSCSKDVDVPDSPKKAYVSDLYSGTKIVGTLTVTSDENFVYVTSKVEVGTLGKMELWVNDSKVPYKVDATGLSKYTFKVPNDGSKMYVTLKGVNLFGVGST